jgi:hypothetical protein
MSLEMSVDVLLLTNQDDFETALPTLKSVAQTTRRAPLFVDGDQDIADVAIIDARTDLEAAQRACRRLTAKAPAIAAVAVVAPADFVAVDVDWCFDDVLLPAAREDELHTRLRLAITPGAAHWRAHSSLVTSSCTRPVSPGRRAARICA